VACNNVQNIIHTIDLHKAKMSNCDNFSWSWLETWCLQQL